MATELQIKTKLISESRFDKNKKDGIQRIGQLAVESIRKNIIDKKITASGRTQASIIYRLTGENGLDLLAKSGDRAPIATLQTGREPGKMPPIEKLKRWIIDKGLKFKPIPYIRKGKHKYTPEQRGLNQLAFMIARKIKEKGTERYINPIDSVYTPVLNDVIKLFKEHIISETQQLVTSKLLK